jgi:hypothetical protein
MRDEHRHKKWTDFVQPRLKTNIRDILSPFCVKMDDKGGRDWTICQVDGCSCHIYKLKRMFGYFVSICVFHWELVRRDFRGASYSDAFGRIVPNLKPTWKSFEIPNLKPTWKSFEMP